MHFEFDRLRHEYQLDCKRIPSVTELMKNHMCVGDPFSFCNPEKGALTHKIFAETCFIADQDQEFIEESYRAGARPFGISEVMEEAIEGARRFNEALLETYHRLNIVADRRNVDIEKPRYHTIAGHHIGFTPDFYDHSNHILIEIKTWDGTKTLSGDYTWGDIQAAIYSYFITENIKKEMKTLASYILVLSNGKVIVREPKLDLIWAESIVKSFLVMDAFKFGG